MNYDQERAPLLQDRPEQAARSRQFDHKKKESIIRAMSITFLLGIFAFLIIKRVRHVPSIQMCSSRDCFRLAGEILADMDDGVNPCDDFWSFTCGGYVKNHPIFDDIGFDGRAFEAHKKIPLSMRELLEDNFPLYYNSTEEDSKYDKEAWKKFRNYYDSCVNVDNERVDSPSLTPLVNSIVSRFPANKRKLSQNNFTMVLSDLARVGIFPFVFVTPDPDYKAGNVTLAVYPTMATFSAGLHFVPTPYRWYKAYDVKVVRDIYHMAISEVIANVLPRIDGMHLSNRTVADIVDSIIAFEEKWLRVSVAPRKTYPPTDSSATVDRDRLYEVSDIVNWQRYFEDVAPKDVELPDTVTVNYPKTLEKVHDLIKDTDPQTIKFTLLWRALFQAWYSNLPRWARYEEQINLALGFMSTNTWTLWESCVSEAMFVMPAVAGRAFIYSVLEPHAKQNIDTYIAEINAAYIDRFNTAEWVAHDSDRKALMEMVKATNWETIVFGGDPDLSSARSVADSVRNISVSSNSYVSNSLNFVERTLNKSWGYLGKSPDKMPITSSHIPVWMVNAVNYVYQNRVIIPGGLAQKPWYADSNPDYLNFGAIGTIIGHEAAVKFSADHINATANGKKIPSVSNDTVNEVMKRTACIANQNDLYPRPLGFPSEVASDQAGLRQSFAAWSKRRNNLRFIGKNMQLPGLSLTDEQLFYVAYARKSCANRRQAPMISQAALNPMISAMTVWQTEAGAMMRILDNLEEGDISDSDKAVLSYNVNMGVRNLPGFAEVFGCPIGSPMNPQDKCEVW
jgi:endothelin-converting enzyme